MKTNELKELSPLEKATLPTAAMPGRMGSLGRSMKRPPRRILGQFGGENAGGQAYHVNGVSQWGQSSRINTINGVSPHGLTSSFKM